jgi:hypothetical protein
VRTIVRPLIPVFAAALLMVAAAQPAAAQSAPPGCVVASGTLLNGGSVSFTAPPGHTWTFVYTGAASGQISITGTLNIVNGTGGTLYYVVYDDNVCEAIPTLSQTAMGLMALLLAGLGVLVLRLGL